MIASASCGTAAAPDNDRRVLQRVDRVDLVLRRLHGDRVLHARSSGSSQNIGWVTAAAAERDEHVAGDVLLGEAHLAGQRAIDVDIQVRSIAAPAGSERRPFPGRPSCPGRICLGQFVVLIDILLRPDDLHVDRRRQAEVQHLRDDVGAAGRRTSVRGTSRPCPCESSRCIFGRVMVFLQARPGFRRRTETSASRR